MRSPMPNPVHLPRNASDVRYSSGNRLLGCTWNAPHRLRGSGLGGRGPPQWGPRSELQAMSNSLQLTSI
jgi:hypothetical protein